MENGQKCKVCKLMEVKLNPYCEESKHGQRNGQVWQLTHP